MEINWYAIMSAVITLLCTIITVVVIPWIKTKISNEDLAKVKVWVKTAVQAAEMIYTAAGMGGQKKAYVIAFISDLLAKAKITLTDEEINNLIESAVLELKLQEG